MRRIILIAGAIIILLGVGVGLYFLFFRHTATLTGTSGANFPSSGTNGSASSAATPRAEALGVPVPGAGKDIAPRLVQITDQPVALGAVAVYIPAQKPATTTATGTPISAYQPDVKVEYVERASGNVYAYLAHARTLTRMSNKTLPGVQEATWLPDGSLSYVRFLEKNGTDEHIDTYALPAMGTNGFFLQQDLSQVLARASSTLVTLLSTTDGSSATASTATGGNVHAVFSTPLSSIHLAFLGSNYLVTTKASANIDGYAFSVDKSGAFTRVLGPLTSLSTLPNPAGTAILYSYLDRGKLALGVLDLTNRTAIRLPLATLPEKCAWSADGLSIYCGVPTTDPGTNQPDDWYQGASSFSDRLWKIDLQSRVATLLIDPKQAAGAAIDMEGLTLDTTSDILVFMNKTDHTLYAYDL